jgi:hypothetical protein
MLNDKKWLDFILEVDTYRGPLTVGQLFCKLFKIKDPEVSTADDDTVWQIIANKYREKN